MSKYAIPIKSKKSRGICYRVFSEEEKCVIAFMYRYRYPVVAISEIIKLCPVSLNNYISNMSDDEIDKLFIEAVKNKNILFSLKT